MSIHAPRVGGDSLRINEIFQIRYFNPRPPCGGRRFALYSAWETQRYFNPRPPCGGRLMVQMRATGRMVISIHAPRVGGDDYYIESTNSSVKFQSTPPVWGATDGVLNLDLSAQNISIHAPRVGAT